MTAKELLNDLAEMIQKHPEAADLAVNLVVVRGPKSRYDYNMPVCAMNVRSRKGGGPLQVTFIGVIGDAEKNKF